MVVPPAILSIVLKGTEMDLFPTPLHAPWSSYSSSVLTHSFLVFRNKFPEVLFTCAHFRTGTQMCTSFMMLSWNLEVEKKGDSALSLWSGSFIFFVVWIRGHSCVSDLCICLRIVYTKLFSTYETRMEISLSWLAFRTITLHTASSYKMPDSGCVCWAMDEAIAVCAPL